MASLYMRGRFFWVAYWVNGKQRQKSLGTKNETVARNKLKRLEYELAIGDLQKTSHLRLATILEEFCQHLRAKHPHKSCANDVSRLRVFFGQVCESLKLKPVPVRGSPGTFQQRRDQFAHAHVTADFVEQITPELINRFISARMREERWSEKTANRVREILQRFFNYAIRHHGYRSPDRRYVNPAAAVDRQREPAPEIRFLTLDQIDEQLRVLKNRAVLHALVATYIYAGLRREEALWLTHEDVNLEKRLIHVRAKTIDGRSWQPKTKRNRVVPISTTLLAIIEAYEPPVRCAWYFSSPTGKRWDPDNLSQDLSAVNERHGLVWTCLDYRHTFGSQLAQRGESLYKIAALMGNSPDICRRHYAALVPEAMHDSVEFATPVGASEPEQPADGETAELLKELLAEIRSSKEVKSEKPKLRVVRE